MKAAKWISAGVISLFTGLAGAGEEKLVTVPVSDVNKSGAPQAEAPKVELGAPACDPWPTECDPCCPAKPAKIKCGPRPKIIVHQSEPIVEFRDAPSKPICATCKSRPVINDRAVKPCGGELFGHGCGCKTGFFKGKHQHCAQGAMPMQMTQQTVMTAVPMTVQAYVPQTIQTLAFAPAVQTFAAPAVQGFAAQPFVAPQSVGLGFTGMNVATASADAGILRAYEALVNASAASARVQSTATNGPSNTMAIQAAAAAADKAASLEKRLESIDERLLSVERRLKALCVTQ